MHVFVKKYYFNTCGDFRFNSLFRFLVNVRRTQMELQNVWTLYKGRRAAQKGISKDIWLLRMEMTFLVDNLQYYLQVLLLVTFIVILVIMC